MMTEFDVPLPAGGILHEYDIGPADPAALPVIWHHGTPNVGAPPEPLFETADRLGLRWVSYDRPGYGGSTPQPGRTVRSAASWASAVADQLAFEKFAVMGHSGGGPHALACAALLPDRVVGAVTGASLAPYGAGRLDWFAGMISSGAASLTAATKGREAKHAYETSGADYDPEFTDADLAALSGKWAWLGVVAGAGAANGPGGLIDDDIAYVSPWGFEPAAITVPVLLLHGGRDRIVPGSHSRWLAAQIASSELGFTSEDGHISVLNGADAALKWLRDQTC